MDLHQRLNLAMAVAVAMLPLVVMVYFLVRRRRYLPVTDGRYWAAMAGLVLSLVASLPTPLFYFWLEFQIKPEWLPIAARVMPMSLMAGLVAIVLLAFGRDRLRWMGIMSMVLCVAFLYLTLLGLSD
jgi:hypothetical protein